MMNDFEKTYLNILLENGKFESFEKNVYVFNNVTKIIRNKNIIFESKKDPGFKNLCSKILNSKFNEKISFEKIQEYFKNSLKTADNRPIIIFPIDFENPNHISWILNKFSLTYGIKEKSLEKIRKKEALKFKTDMINASGAITQAEDAYLLFLNTNENYKANIETVEHELEHYIQYIERESLINGITEKFSSKNFKMSLNEIQYYLSDTEFIPNIKINLVRDFKKVYAIEYFNKISKLEFLKLYFNEIENDSLNILNSDFGCNYRNITGHHKVFSLLPICKLIQRNDLFIVGCKILKEQFLK